MRFSSIVFGLIGMACVALTAPLAAAETFRSEEHGFQVEIPAGWKRVPDEMVRELEAAAFKNMSQSSTDSQAVSAHFLAGYSKASGKQWKTPYLIVQITAFPMRGATYEDLARGFNATTLQGEVSKSVHGALKHVSVGRAVVDAANNRLLMTMDLQTVAGPVKAQTIGFFGVGGVAQFNLYSKPADASKDVAELEAMLETFRFDPGSQFVSGKGGGGSSAYRSGQMAGSVVAFALMAAVVLWVVKKILRR